MGVRLTGISTPVGGLSWEYMNDAKQSEKVVSFSSDNKIKIFISSICGVEKYDKIRAELKEIIEATNLAQVYSFEEKGASTLSAGNHYSWALQDSDVCIFLIDNADGISSGVQSEIDTVKKHNIKALYYFCDETLKEKTPFEQSLMGADYAKSRTVHCFNELGKDGAQSLINDIVLVYHYFCSGKLVERKFENDEIERIEVVGTENYQLPIIPKTTINHVDKCKNYILEFVLGRPCVKYNDNIEKTGPFDEWAFQFLPILFEGKSIRHFNVAMYLEELSNYQEIDYYHVVETRWKAIQSYFSGDLGRCLEYLKEALKLAKETNQASWIIKDILIDLRNEHLNYCTEKNEYFEDFAQKELSESNEQIYYPILDRINESLQEKYIDELYKKKTESPYSITLGNSLNQYGEMIASSLVISMYNGSLTHILLIYKRLRDFVFYLSTKYSDWNFKLILYKLVIFLGKEKEITGIQNSYPEILNNLTSKEAASIMDFCMNQPIEYKRLNSQLLAFGAICFFLDDDLYTQYEESIVSGISDWIECKNHVVAIGQNIFECLTAAAYRMKQDVLSNICCKFINNQYSRWYIDMFKFIAARVDLNKMSSECAKSLVNCVVSIFDDEIGRKEINYAPMFLCVLRNQSSELTNELDKKIAEYMTLYYEGDYKLETSQNEERDFPKFVKEYTEIIKNSTINQGKNGVYYGRATRDFLTVRNILLANSVRCPQEIMDTLISSAADTVLVSKECISTKLDAICLLTCIVVKYSNDYIRNKCIYEKIYKYQDNIHVNDNSFLSSNIDGVSLSICMQFLFAIIGKDVYSEILGIMPYIKDSVATTIEVTNFIVDLLEISDDILLPEKVESVVLQNALQWLQSEYLDIRWNATRIFLTMSRNPDNCDIVNRQLISMIDFGSAHIKNLILRKICYMPGIEESTKEYIISKCKNDSNYVVRMVCKEVLEKK